MDGRILSMSSKQISQYWKPPDTYLCLELSTDFEFLWSLGMCFLPLDATQDMSMCMIPCHHQHWFSNSTVCCGPKEGKSQSCTYSWKVHSGPAQDVHDDIILYIHHFVVISNINISVYNTCCPRAQFASQHDYMQQSHSAKSEWSVKQDHGYRIGGSELFHAELLQR